MNCSICRSPAAPDELEAGLCSTCRATYHSIFQQRPPLEPGHGLMGGTLVVEQIIGVGGSGLIYQTREQASGARVAVKEIFPAGCSRDGYQVVAAGREAQTTLAECTDHARNEANVLAVFDHPGLLKIHATFEENSTVYTVMELLEGQDVRQRSGGGLKVEQLLDWVGQVCDALETLHQRGVIHGDIKPDNLYVTEEGRCVLLDFGAAIYYKAGRAETREMTAGYAAPEQLPRSRHREGPWTDLYSLCATLYHLLCGRLPAAEPSVRKKDKLVELHQVRPDVPEQVSAAILGGLDLEPDRRPASLEIFTALIGAPPSRFAEPDKLIMDWQFDGRLRPIRAVDASADGQVLAAGGQSGTTFLSPVSGKQDPLKLRVSGQLSGLALNHRGDRIVAGSDLGTVKLFSAKGDELACLLEERRIGSVAFAPNNMLLAAGLFEGQVLVWNNTGAVAHTLEGHDNMVRCLAFSPDCKQLASGSHDGTARLWDVTTGQELRRFDEHDQVVYALRFSPNGRLVATGAADSVVRVWVTSEGTQTRTLRGEGEVVRGLAFSPDGQWIAVACQSGHLEIYSLASGRRKAMIAKDKQLVGVVWTQHGLVSVSEDGRLRGWKTDLFTAS
ncbi:MAG: serine/threonine protein kinase [Candidatus Eremiobacteraeota bacterium]|nr:serine/threonine protein kinase [Candidatus Eremiobacteraeota bacterium]